LFAPAKTPAATVQALSEAVRRALNAPGLKARLLESGAEPAPSTPAELATLLKQDTDKWAKLIRDKKIKPE
jgi:tripartite-type tricarboxylate transporter receptor subunit TctC